MDVLDTAVTGRTRKDEGLSGMSFVEAASLRPPTRTKKSVVTFAKVRDFNRFTRLRRDFDWFARTVGKIGVSRDEARFLL